MDLTWITLTAAVTTIALYIYQYVKKCHSYWKNLNIPYLEPTFFFGNMFPVLIRRYPISTYYKELYQKLSPHRFAGYFMVLKPNLLVRDPEIIKQILTKDFHHFQDRGIKSDIKLEPLSNHLVILKGEEWKNLRIKLTPTFTSGKIKLMFPLIKECAEEMVKVIEKNIGQDQDFKDLAARFTSDVIGTCAFGLQPHSLENPDSEFRRIGKKIFNSRFAPLIRVMFPKMPLFLIRLFNLKFIEDEVRDFFVSLVKDTVKFREETGTRRNDFLDLLIALKNETDHQGDDKEADLEVTKLNELKLSSKDNKKKTHVDMTVELMTAQCFLFFGAGFETSSNAITFLLFELAQNPKVQLKLQEEVDKVMTLCNNDLDYYDVIREMRYLDMVLSEALRKYPPAAALQRACTETYKIPDSDVVIAKNQTVVIPVIGLHHDPMYYPNPDTFNPENFSEEAKTARPQFAYLPFGDGPRVCIAERFARLEVKLAVACLVRNFEFNLSNKTEIPLKFERNFGLLCVNQMWLQCKSRRTSLSGSK